MDGAFDQRDGFIWMNGTLIPWTDARVRVLTHGLHYASSVFEGERAYAGAIFKLREHTERLIYSAKELGFEIPYAAGEIDAACIETLEANGLVDGYLRPVAWRGSEMMVCQHKITGLILPLRVGMAVLFRPGRTAQGYSP